MKRSGGQHIELTVHDFHHRPKNNFWFVGVGLLAVAAAYVAIAAHDYLMLAVIVAAAFALFRVAGFGPSSRTVRLDRHGLTWGNRFFGYHQLKAFWMVAHPDSVTVHLERPNAGLSISFIVGADQAKAIAETLARHLPYHAHRGEPIGERFARLLQL